MKREYCKCENPKLVYTDFDDFAQWDVCGECNKEIDETYQYLNHYDGEDHVFYYE